jgi:hypothetical protein
MEETVVRIPQGSSPATCAIRLKRLAIVLSGPHGPLPVTAVVPRCNHTGRCMGGSTASSALSTRSALRANLPWFAHQVIHLVHRTAPPSALQTDCLKTTRVSLLPNPPLRRFWAAPRTPPAPVAWRRETAAARPDLPPPGRPGQERRSPGLPASARQRAHSPASSGKAPECGLPPVAGYPLLTCSSPSTGSGLSARASNHRVRSAGSIRLSRPFLPLLLSCPASTARVMTPVLTHAALAAWVTVHQGTSTVLPSLGDPFTPSPLLSVHSACWPRHHSAIGDVLLRKGALRESH